MLWNDKVNASTHYLKDMVYFMFYYVLGLSNIKFQNIFLFITLLIATNGADFHIS